MIMILFNDMLLAELSKRENAKAFLDVAVEEYLTDGNLEMFLLSVHYLIEIYKKPLDRQD